MDFFGNFLKDIFYPKRCCGCGNIGSYVCLACQKKLQEIHCDICVYCRKKSYLGLTHPLCRKKGGVDGALCFFRYHGLVRKMLSDAKYRGIREAIAFLAEYGCITHQEKILSFSRLFPHSLLIPIPLHKNRQKQRGFNQSQIIATSLSKYTPFIIHTDCLMRNKETKPQSMLRSFIQKKHNIKEAFIIPPLCEKIIMSKTIILIDDIATSFATTQEACKTLKKHKVARVFVITLAR